MGFKVNTLSEKIKDLILNPDIYNYSSIFFKF